MSKFRVMQWASVVTSVLYITLCVCRLAGCAFAQTDGAINQAIGSWLKAVLP